MAIGTPGSGFAYPNIKGYVTPTDAEAKHHREDPISSQATHCCELNLLCCKTVSIPVTNGMRANHLICCSISKSTGVEEDPAVSHAVTSLDKRGVTIVRLQPKPFGGQPTSAELMSLLGQAQHSHQTASYSIQNQRLSSPQLQTGTDTRYLPMQETKL